MRQSWLGVLVSGLLVSAAVIQAQEASDPLTAALRRQFDGVALNLKEAAEKMPEEKYPFKPSPDVRTYAAEVGHAANANYNFCARAKGEPNPNKQDFEKVTGKADLVKAMIASNEYCAALFNGANDKWLLELVGQGPMAQPRAAVIAQNISHANETYGTMVPYMRMNGIVPPSTARAQQQRRQ